MNTEHFTKLQTMGYPDGCNEWGPLEIDVRYSEWRMKRRRLAWYAALLVADVTVGVVL